MTVIAYRNGLMACDSCWNSVGTQTVSAVKIIRTSAGALLGSAGDNDAREMYALLDKIKSPDKLPTRAQLAATKLDYEGLLVFPKGGVWMIATGRHDDAGYPLGDDGAAPSDYDFGCWQIAGMGGYAACGSGGDVALAAMDAGASAKQAVEIAIRRNVYCRAPVHVKQLHEAKVNKAKRRG